MGAAPLSWLAKIGGDTLKTKAKLLSSAINELYDDGFKKRDIVGLDYIKAATADDLKNKVPEANAVKALNSNLNNKANSSHTHDDRYYTETEVDNKISTINSGLNNLSNTVSTINGNLNNLSNTVSNLNNNMNVRYVPSTDMVQIYYNGSWMNWKSAGFNAINFLQTAQSAWALSNLTLVAFGNGITLRGVNGVLTGTMTYNNAFSTIAGKTLSLIAESWHTNQISDGNTLASLIIKVSVDGVNWINAINRTGENVNTSANVRTAITGSCALSGNEKYIRIEAGTTYQAHLTHLFNFAIKELKIS